MRRGERNLSHMAAAAFVAATGAGPVIAPLEDHTGVNERFTTTATSAPTELADPETLANRAMRLARKWARIAMTIEGPQAPTMRSQRMIVRANNHHGYDRHGDRCPQLRRGRFW